ncbi:MULTISPECIES: hypothetical protein [Nocardiopsis]|nr:MULTISPECIES: hypothetical protein [Nocardiopsis]
MSASPRVVVVGARPDTDWLEGSGPEVADGPGCDAHCRAADGVYELPVAW